MKSVAIPDVDVRPRRDSRLPCFVTACEGSTRRRFEQEEIVGIKERIGIYLRNWEMVHWYNGRIS